MIRTTLIAAAVSVLAACGNKEAGSSTSGSTQVAAKVGKAEISIHQVNQALAQTNTGNAITPQSAEAMRRQVLERLIDQQLIVEQARERKLDRSPEVVAQMEAVRREVLARAYVRSVAQSQPRPSADEVKKYYADNPQLFSQRRIFTVQELLLPPASEAAAAVREQVAAGKSMDEVANWLRGRNIQVRGGGATRAAEQIRTDILARLHTMKDGQAAAIDGPQGLTAIWIISSQSAPLTEANARQSIESFLANQRGAQAMEQQLKDLRAQTEISYMGGFAENAAAKTEEATESKTPPAPKAAADNASPDDQTRTAIEKGIGGLLKR